ncbi:hypothetical protein Tsp_01433 [Trichinella spiralis]|uniref:hypothetical protein n=1 Tax=Trichinella spiralis TaxID=6334 RepID=UPI0001EFB4E4|nr:hypothetical protein Tsp_01433 [Trichinella spiralis]
MFAYGKFLPLRLYIYIMYTNLFLRVVHKYTAIIAHQLIYYSAHHLKKLSNNQTSVIKLPRFCSRLNLLCREIFGAQTLIAVMLEIFSRQNKKSYHAFLHNAPKHEEKENFSVHEFSLNKEMKSG